MCWYIHAVDVSTNLDRDQKSVHPPALGLGVSLVLPVALSDGEDVEPKKGVFRSETLSSRVVAGKKSLQGTTDL